MIKVNLLANQLLAIEHKDTCCLDGDLLAGGFDARPSAAMRGYIPSHLKLRRINLRLPVFIRKLGTQQ